MLAACASQGRTAHRRSRCSRTWHPARLTGGCSGPAAEEQTLWEEWVGAAGRVGRPGRVPERTFLPPPLAGVVAALRDSGGGQRRLFLLYTTSTWLSHGRFPIAGFANCDDTLLLPPWRTLASPSLLRPLFIPREKFYRT
eukprot:6846669-Prymnesium_polylepis.1